MTYEISRVLQMEYFALQWNDFLRKYLQGVTKLKKNFNNFIFKKTPMILLIQHLTFSFYFHNL